MTDALKPIIIGHRGASADAPENTLAAFRLALEQGADGIELDAKLTADGQVIVIHDPTVDRTTNGKGKIKELTLAALRELDAGGWKNPQYAGEKLPMLDEVFETVGHRLLVNVELTNYADPGDALLEKVAELVKRHGVEKNVIFSSFLPNNISRIRKLLPGVPAGLLALEGSTGILSRSFIGRWFSPQMIHPYFTDADRAYIAREHRRGRRVNVWTVDEPDDIRRLITDDVDGIITDNPKLALQIRADVRPA
jgi:glycerophosphoryl diester phosphodiesterase